MSERAGSASTRSQRLLLGAILVMVAVVSLAYLGLGLLSASTTLGCDYGSYSGAANRFLAGDPVYLPGPARTGECPLFPYPPPFVLLVLPFVALGSLGMYAWIFADIVAFIVGTAILPVDRWIRIGIFLMGSFGWPLIFGVRIGQVVPMLYLVYAIGWRCLDRPAALGFVTGVGTLMKVQPGLILVWLIGRRRWRAAATAVATIAVISTFAAAVGLVQWSEFLRTATQITAAVDVPANLSIGASAYKLGVSIEIAGVLQTLNTIAVIVFALAAARMLSNSAGFVATVAATQILAPIVWSHYALILLLPIAWLLQRRQWWALIIPFSQAWVLTPFINELVYSASFYGVIAAVVVADHLDARRTSGSPGRERLDGAAR